MIVQAGTGAPLVAWSRNSPSGFDIVTSRFVDGAWTTPVAIAATGANELDPVLVADPASGSVHLLYWVDASPWRVMYMQAPADLSSWTAPLQVSQQANAACRPSAVFHQGLLRVVYEIHDLGGGTTPRQIALATYDGLVPFLTQTVAMTNELGANWPEVHSGGGKLWVDWIDGAGQMGWRRQPQPGVWDPVQVEPFSSAGERDYHVRGAVKALALQ
jgi:hypothetical protein